MREFSKRERDILGLLSINPKEWVTVGTMAQMLGVKVEQVFEPAHWLYVQHYLMRERSESIVTYRLSNVGEAAVRRLRKEGWELDARLDRRPESRFDTIVEMVRKDTVRIPHLPRPTEVKIDRARVIEIVSNAIKEHIIKMSRLDRVYLSTVEGSSEFIIDGVIDTVEMAETITHRLHPYSPEELRINMARQIREKYNLDTPPEGDPSKPVVEELLKRGWLSEDIRTFVDEGKTVDDLGPTAMELSSKNQTSSAGRFWGRSVIYGKEDDHATPYMTRYWIGRLRLHIFHRGDQDPDCHDHPWDFWTFPFTPYVEEVVDPMITDTMGKHPDLYEGYWDGEAASSKRPMTKRQIVPAWRWTFRPATHTHRVIGPYDPRGEVDFGCMPTIETRPGRIITLVWRGKSERDWGFLKNRDGKWCWVAWKEYVFGGGKSAPCE